MHFIGGMIRYLEFLVLVGRSKSQTFKFIRERVQCWMQGWSKKFISHAGRETLLKSISSTIPNFTMSCFLLPKTLCKKISSLVVWLWYKKKSLKTLEGNTKSKEIIWLRFQGFLIWLCLLNKVEGNLWIIIVWPNHETQVL